MVPSRFGTQRHRNGPFLATFQLEQAQCQDGTKSADVARVSRLLLLMTAAVAYGCSEPSEHPEPPGGAGAAGTAAIEPSVELGVPGGEDGLDFVPLAQGSELRLQTFGQGGTHVMIAVRCVGFGNRAFVSATLRNLSSDVEVVEPAPARPQLLYCADGGETCDLVPYLAHASGLTATDEEKDGLAVLLTARARNEAGAMAEGSREIVLSTADL
jgi:hypothetical protein